MAMAGQLRPEHWRVMRAIAARKRHCERKCRMISIPFSPSKRDEAGDVIPWVLSIQDIVSALVVSIWLGRILGKSETAGETRGEEYILQGIKILDELKIEPYQAQGYLFLGELYGDRARLKKLWKPLKRPKRWG
jgi:hypothetical protein